MNNYEIELESVLLSDTELDLKSSAFFNLLKSSSSRAYDILSRLKDIYVYSSKENRDELCLLFKQISLSDKVNETERILLCVFLFNVNRYDICHILFEYCAKDITICIPLKLDCCKFLFSTNTDENKEKVISILEPIIQDMNINVEKRYDIIISYYTKKGLKTMFNFERLNAPMDEEFVKKISFIFFNNKNNNIRYLILCGDGLLNLDILTTIERREIEEFIFSICTDNKYDTNTVADAADILIRSGTEGRQHLARKIIDSLGNQKDSNRLDGIIKTIYTNTQNAHDSKISKCAIDFIDKIFSTETYNVSDISDTLSYVKNIIYKDKKLSNTNKYRINRSLNRIRIDRSKFTSYHLTLESILCIVVDAIKEYKITKELHTRLLDELDDMFDTCSTGYINRLVNIFIGIDGPYKNILTIEWEDQIHANIVTRINYCMQHEEDSNLRDELYISLPETADKEHKHLLKCYINKCFDNIIKELYTEFVSANHITDEQFKNYTSKSLNIILNKFNILEI